MDKKRLRQRVKTIARVCQILVDPSAAVSPPWLLLPHSVVQKHVSMGATVSGSTVQRSQARGERVRVMRRQDLRAEATGSTLPGRCGDFMPLGP